MIRALLVLAIAFSATSAYAEEAEDVVLDRNKVIQSMKSKEQKLKLQADMSKHYKQMEEAGFFVDEDGNPLGITSIPEMAVDFRNKSKSANTGSSDPFMAFDAPEPGELPFGASAPLGGGQGVSAPVRPQAERRSAKSEGQSYISLQEIRANSVLVQTATGLVEIKPGQKVGDLKLVRFDADRAYLVDSAGDSKVLTFDWGNSNRRTGM